MRSQTTLVGVCICAVMVAGCAGGALGPAVATYGAANIFSPVGYSQTQIDETHYTVTATGSEVTPTARVEKLARTRAAQIGVEQKLGYFKVAGVSQGAACTDKDTRAYKAPGTVGSARPTVALDVLYSKEQTDPSYLPSKATFEALTAELQAEQVSPEEQQSANQEILARCGQG